MRLHYEGKALDARGRAEWEIRPSYGTRTAAMRQELDAVPAEAEGAAPTRAQIENRMEIASCSCAGPAAAISETCPKSRREAPRRYGATTD
ncbi:MAG: hypothetical protein Q4615_05335 [Paracoccus aminovorans]|nr:hypothetical protein [Paracoccus aminovorans]